jgi:hypothetical protein
LDRSGGGRKGVDWIRYAGDQLLGICFLRGALEVAVEGIGDGKRLFSWPLLKHMVMPTETQNATSTNPNLPSRIRAIPWLMDAHWPCGGARVSQVWDCGRDAVSYARWDARNTGGKVEVFDQQGQLYRKICVKADELADSAFVLPSAWGIFL